MGADFAEDLGAGLAALIDLPATLGVCALAETDLAAGSLVLLADRGRAGLAFLDGAGLGFLAGVGAFFKMVHLQGLLGQDDFVTGSRDGTHVGETFGEQWLVGEKTVRHKIKPPAPFQAGLSGFQKCTCGF